VDHSHAPADSRGHVCRAAEIDQLDRTTLFALTALRLRSMIRLCYVPRSLTYMCTHCRRCALESGLAQRRGSTPDWRNLRSFLRTGLNVENSCLQSKIFLAILSKTLAWYLRTAEDMSAALPRSISLAGQSWSSGTTCNLLAYQ